MINVLITAMILFGPYQAQPVRVIDGDTVELHVALWPGMYQTIKLRLDGIDTPETQSRGGKKITECEKVAGKKAKAFTTFWLQDKRLVTVHNIHLGKYAGRALGNISYNGLFLSDALLRAGLARKYDGGKRKGWCD